MEILKKYGLVGLSLKHSFSKEYFTKKFIDESIDSKYDLFEIDDISKISNIIKEKNINGLNVTTPYKEKIIPYLDAIDSEAKQIGAVNTVKIDNGKLIGYNTDFYGFKKSLLGFLPSDYSKISALILGDGGVSKAVSSSLFNLNIPYTIVSRNNTPLYDELTEEHIKNNLLIINTTTLGMFPLVDDSPKIPYQYLTTNHYLFDMIYNPEITSFMKKGNDKGAKIKNGLEMLYLQAEKSWDIWNSKI